MYELYVVTDDRLSMGRGHVAVSELALKGGADVIQLRDKEMDDASFLECARQIRALCSEYHRLFIVNDRLDIALECGADGAHLGQSDMPISEARKKVPKNFILGCSVSTAEEAAAAERSGADYVALSPVFDTGSKSDAGPGNGLKALALIREAVSVPVIAIGGINRQNAAGVIRAGAEGVAVISAVVSQPDVEKAARELRETVVRALSETR